MVLSLGCLKSSAHNFQTIHISIIIQIGYHDHWLLINYVKPKFFRGEPKCIYIFFGRGGARGGGVERGGGRGEGVGVGRAERQSPVAST